MFSITQKVLSGILTLIGILNCNQESFAFDVNLLKNDKELVSHAFHRLQKKRAIKKVSSQADSSFQSLSEILNHLESKKQLCEIPLYLELKSKNPQHSIRDLLIVWRSENRIDDLFFKIVDQTADAIETLKSFKVDQPTDREIEKAKTMIAEQELTAMELSLLYQDFKDATLQTPGCTLETWNETSKELRGLSKEKGDLRLFNIAALNEKILNDREFELVEFYRANRIQDWTISLDHYLDLLKTVKNTSRPKEPSEKDLLPNSLSSKKKKAKGIRKRMTYRESIYSKFNSTQILMIEQVMKKTFDRMDATKTEVVFTFKEGSETVPVSPMGQYYLARRLLRKEMDDLNRSSFFQGAMVTHEDLVAVSLETGLINSEIVDSVLKIDDLWNPETPKWRKIANFGFQITGTATIFLPPPYNIISSIALVFIDGIIQRGIRKASQAEADYDFF